jgi:hypothetical protein
MMLEGSHMYSRLAAPNPNGQATVTVGESAFVPVETTVEKAASEKPGEIIIYMVDMKVEVRGGFLPPEKRHVAAYLRGRLGVPEQDDTTQPYRIVAVEVRNDLSGLKK